MNCSNCCEAFIGPCEGYHFIKNADKIVLCRCCKNEYLALGGLGWTLIGQKKEEDFATEWNKEMTLEERVALLAKTFDNKADSDDDEEEEEEENPYMLELIECRMCDIEKPRKNMHWNTNGSYTNICEECEVVREFRRQEILNRPPIEKHQCVVCEEQKAMYSIGFKCKTCKNSMCQVCCCEYSTANEGKFKYEGDETGCAVDIYVPCPICRTINSFCV